MSIDGWIFEDKKSGGGLFLRVKPDCRLKVRLIGKPMKILKVFSRDKKCAILDSAETGELLKGRHAGKVGDVNMRYVCWCFDRDDSNSSLKVLDMPQSVARSIGNRQILTGKSVSGNQEGCDWQIMTNGRIGKEVRYDAVYLDESPLTEAEIQMIKDKRESKDEKFNLLELFKPLNLAQAEEMLFG